MFAENVQRFAHIWELLVCSNSVWTVFVWFLINAKSELSAFNSHLLRICDLFPDQTPTPTRFLKNCEEVGLFNELASSFEPEDDEKRAKNTVRKTNDVFIRCVHVCLCTFYYVQKPKVSAGFHYVKNKTIAFSSFFLNLKCWFSQKLQLEIPALHTYYASLEFQYLQQFVKSLVFGCFCVLLH